MKKSDFFRNVAVVLLVSACCLGRADRSLAQDVIWTEVHKFGPPDEALPWVLSLGAGPDGSENAGLLQQPSSFYRTTDQGRTWEARNLDEPHIEAIVTRPDGVLFVAAYGDGILRSDDSSYFPLDLTNSWTYFKVMDPPNAPPDTLWGGTFTISGAVR